jgi:DNA-directed RNA polymerase subunit L
MCHCSEDGRELSPKKIKSSPGVPSENMEEQIQKILEETKHLKPSVRKKIEKALQSRKKGKI